MSSTIRPLTPDEKKLVLDKAHYHIKCNQRIEAGRAGIIGAVPLGDGLLEDVYGGFPPNVPAYKAPKPQNDKAGRVGLIDAFGIDDDAKHPLAGGFIDAGLGEDVHYGLPRHLHPALELAIALYDPAAGKSGKEISTEFDRRAYVETDKPSLIKAKRETPRSKKGLTQAVAALVGMGGFIGGGLGSILLQKPTPTMPDPRVVALAQMDADEQARGHRLPRQDEIVDFEKKVETAQHNNAENVQRHHGKIGRKAISDGVSIGVGAAAITGLALTGIPAIRRRRKPFLGKETTIEFEDLRAIKRITVNDTGSEMTIYPIDNGSVNINKIAEQIRADGYAKFGFRDVGVYERLCSHSLKIHLPRNNDFKITPYQILELMADKRHIAHSDLAHAKDVLDPIAEHEHELACRNGITKPKRIVVR